MKKIFFVILIGVFIFAIGFIYLYVSGGINMKLGFLEKMSEKKVENKEILRVKGNYLLNLASYEVVRINDIDFRLVTGWVNAYDIEILEGYHFTMIYADVVGEDETVASMIRYDGRIALDISQVFVLDNGKERSLNNDDLAQIENDGMWTFQYKYELNIYGDNGNNKLILQRPKIDKKELIINNFIDKASVVDEKGLDVNQSDRLVLLQPAGFQGVKTIKDSDYSISYYNYILGMFSRKNSIREYGREGTKAYIKINNVSEELPSDEKSRADDRMVENYIFRGDYLCSSFNNFCFLYIKDLVYNSKFSLQESDNTIWIDGFSIDDSNFNESRGLENNAVFSIKKNKTGNNYFLSRRANFSEDLEDIKINVDKFINSNKELSSRLEKLNNKGTEIIFKGDYHLITKGKLVCEDIFNVEYFSWLNCILYPDSFSLNRLDNQLDGQ